MFVDGGVVVIDSDGTDRLIGHRQLPDIGMIFSHFYIFIARM